MSDFPVALSNVLDDSPPGTGTDILAKFINNLEAKVGIDSSAVTTSLDYLLKSSSSVDPGHLHTVLSGGVTLAKMANLAANSFIGNNTGSPATPIALTTAQTKTLLAIAQADVSGLTTASSPQFAGIGVATAAVANYGLTAIINATLGAAATGCGLNFICKDNTVSSNTHYIQGMVAEVDSYVDTGITNSGYLQGVNIGAYQRLNGTVSRMDGINMSVGIYGAAGADLTATVTTINGISLVLYNRASATISTAKGMDITLPTTGTVTSSYGININANSLAVTNKFGLYIGAMSGGVTNNYAIYANGGQSYFAGQIGLGQTTPNAAALLHMTSTTQGFLPPVMTTTQKAAISSPPEGLQVYDSTLHAKCTYNGSTWKTSAPLESPSFTTPNIGVASGTSLAVTGGFGCNGAAIQTAYVSGGALAGYVTGAFGLDSSVHMQAMFNLVVAMRAALVANGIMS